MYVYRQKSRVTVLPPVTPGGSYTSQLKCLHKAEEAAVLLHYARVLSLRTLVAALGGEDVGEPDEARPTQLRRG